jgi:hypothetical protein
MTLTVSHPSSSEWDLTVWIGQDDGSAPADWGHASEADVERLAGLLAQFVGVLLSHPAAEASGAQAVPSAVCFL